MRPNGYLFQHLVFTIAKQASLEAHNQDASAASCHYCSLAIDIQRHTASDTGGNIQPLEWWTLHLAWFTFQFTASFNLLLITDNDSTPPESIEKKKKRVCHQCTNSTWLPGFWTTSLHNSIRHKRERNKLEPCGTHLNKCDRVKDQFWSTIITSMNCSPEKERKQNDTVSSIPN